MSIDILCAHTVQYILSTVHTQLLLIYLIWHFFFYSKKKDTVQYIIFSFFLIFSILVERLT